MLKKSRKKLTTKTLIQITVAMIIVAIGYYYPNLDFNIKNNQEVETLSYNLNDIPEYSGSPYIIINNNIPNFEEKYYTTNSFETYSKLDLKLGRCGVAFANVCKETMPADDEEREDITSIKPTGWRQKKYENIIEGGYLYNRCHLIGWQLTGENDNEQNLITGTRYMNIEGMLPFENKVANYIKENSKNHVLYRVTPIFEGDNLLASGVQMEAYSIEDDGVGICFNIYAYNVQPGINIDYKTGESWIDENN